MELFKSTNAQYNLQSHLSIIGDIHFQQHPILEQEDMQHISELMPISSAEKRNLKMKEGEMRKNHHTGNQGVRRLGSATGVTTSSNQGSKKYGRFLQNKENTSFKSSSKKTKKSSKKTSKSPKCDPQNVNLSDYPQWRAEQGYWIGEYTFLKGDGSPFVSGNWNYPYGNYKGFITGNISGNAYRQRNVFLYPPQDNNVCSASNPTTTGNGICGENGNTKVFEADQKATTCSDNKELGGDIDGLYAGVFPTFTQLVGAENALLYQVFIPPSLTGATENRLLQSQLTTITESLSGQVYRTRTAQGFDVFANIGATNSVSYYRERKVDKEEFYTELNSTIAEYAILTEDLCKWDNNGNEILPVGSLGDCVTHLEESFLLGQE